MAQLGPVLLLAVIAQGFVALAFLLAARTSTVGEFGLVVSTLGMAAFTASLVDFGLSPWVLREGLHGRLSPRRFRALVSLRAATGVLFGAAAVVALRNTEFVLLGVMYGLIVPLQVVESLMLSRLRYLTTAVSVAIVNAIDKLAMLIVTAAAILCGWGRNGLLFGFAVGTVVGVFVALFMGRCASAEPRVLVDDVAKQHGRRGYSLYSLAVASQSLDAWVLTNVASPLIAGQFAAVARWTQPLGLVAGAFAQTNVNRFAAASTHRQARDVLSSGAGLFVTVSLGLGAAMILADPLVNWLLGPEYQASIPVLRLLIAAMLPAMLTQPLISLLQVRGFENQVARIVGGWIFLQLAGLAILAPLAGAMGAALAGLIAQLGTAIGLSGQLRRITRVEDRTLA